jgi:predicted RNase H-like HicB family nuclease
MKLPNYYAYPAIFSTDGDGWEVTFPDLDNCFTATESLEEAITEAQAVLADCMYFREVQKDDIPKPTPVGEITAPDEGFTQIVAAEMPPIRSAWSRKAVKKTLTIPSWLEEELKKHNDINVSAILQEALKEKLHVREPVL